MIQDIAPKKLINHYEPRTVSADSLIMVFDSEGKILYRYNEQKQQIEFPHWKDIPGGAKSPDEDVQYLFSIGYEDGNELQAGSGAEGGFHYFLLQECVDLPDGFTFQTVRSTRDKVLISNEDALAAYTAYHLWQWYRTNRFCGACGCKTKADTKERALRCPSCGHIIYPRINPAVIIGVINGDKLLITRYRTGFAHNALVAGFTEIGETLEETVEREVMEEAGIRVKNIRYYKSQPWGIALDVLMGFYCDVDGDDTIRMDRSELKYAEWVKAEEVGLQPSDFSLTNEMMKRFKEGKQC